MDFASMTKADLDAWATARGYPLDGRMTKANMIADLERQMAEAEAAKGAPAPIEKPADPYFATVTITQSARDPVRLSVNGKSFEIPVGRPVTIPAFLLPALHDAGISYETTR